MKVCYISQFDFQEIHAGYNSIQELSAEFVESIPGLKILDLRDNKISEIPDNILLLQALERLDVTNNNLSKYVTNFSESIIVLFIIIIL